jgi:iron complex outermembrane receptor protein
MQPQVYDIAGTGNASGAVQVTTTATVNDQNTHRDERSSELYLRDAIRLAPQWQAWLGLRHTRLQRESVRTDGSRASDYSDSFTTPWLALSHEWAPQHIVFASWGRGAESDVAPNRTYVVNRGEAVLARSRQWEIGANGSQRQRNWSLTYFDIQRAQTANLGAACSSSTPDSCTFTFDGLAHHRGLEGELSQQLGPLRLEGSALLLRARREGSANPAVNGQRPPNVPEYTAKAGASYTVASLPGLTLGAAAVHEGGRTLLPTDGQLRIPAWTRLDANAQWQQPLADQRRLTWSAGITNLANRRAWREAPYQFEHIYLFPLPERSLRLGLQIDL